MNLYDPVRWGILSTANIARSAFLPGLRAAGGSAYAVAGRDLARTQQYALENGIVHAIEGYANLLADDRVEAVYIPLPNTLHAEWTIAALRAGKPVLCEKPLCISVEETDAVLNVARETGVPLWEAFVFPFRRQTDRLGEVIRSGEIGEIVEIQSNFHFRIDDRANIRLSPDLGGGAMFDVGCYCVRFANLVFEGEPSDAVAVAQWAPEGVDEAMQGILIYGEERHLLFSCGMARPFDRFTRVIGSNGEIRLTNFSHPTIEDTFEVHTPGRVLEERISGPEPPFTNAIRHIAAVFRGEVAPRHLATESSPGVALGIELARRSAYERVRGLQDLQQPMH